MPEAILSHTPSRRSAILGIGTLLGAAALTAEASLIEMNADAKLIAACDRYFAVEQELKRKYGHEDIGDDPLLGEISCLIEQICTLRATTLAGQMARVRVLKFFCPFAFKFDSRLGEEDRMITAVLRDLLPEGQS